MNCEKNPLISLNNDCFFEILSFIFNIREKIRLKRVCKRFFKVIDLYFQAYEVILWCPNIYYGKEEKSLHAPLVEIDFLKIYKQCPKISGINNIFVNIKWNMYQIERIPSLRHLFLECQNLNLNRREIESLIWKSVNLCALKLSNYQWRLFNYRCISSNLIELALIECKISYDTFRNMIKNIGGQLLVFKFSEGIACCPLVSHSLINLISQNCHKLECLSLCASKIGPISALSQIKGLKEIHIDDIVEYIQTKGVIEIIQKNSRLKRLDLAIEPTNLDQLLWTFVDYCPEIEIIDFHMDTEMTKLTFEGVNALIRLNHLKELNQYKKDVYIT